MRVTRVPSVAAAAGRHEHDRGGARTGARLEARARARDERVGGDHERDASAARGDGVGRAEERLDARRAASREQSAPPDVGRQAERAASTAWLGPSANGGRVVPHHSPSTMSVWSPEAASARSAASAARVRASSSGGHTAACPRPPRPHACRRRPRGAARPAAAPTAMIWTAGLIAPLVAPSAPGASRGRRPSGRRRKRRLYPARYEPGCRLAARSLAAPMLRGVRPGAARRQRRRGGTNTPMPSGNASPSAIVSGGCGAPSTKRILRTDPVRSPGPTPSAETTRPMSAK